LVRCLLLRADMQTSSTVNRAVSEWTQARRHALDLVLNREDVRIAVAHGAATVGNAAVAIDVHARSRNGMVEDWIRSVRCSSISNTSEVLRRDSAFVEERVHAVGPERATEYHLVACDRDRFVARVIAQPEEPSEALRRHLNRVSGSIAESLVEADRRLRAALPPAAGHAVFGTSAELLYADEAGRKWLDVDGLSQVASYEVLQLLGRAEPTTAFFVLGAEVTITALSGQGSNACLLRFRRAAPMLASPRTESRYSTEGASELACGILMRLRELGASIPRERTLP
jgi:hypothetical protein